MALDRAIDPRSPEAGATHICNAVIDLAKRKYGFAAASKLQAWGIHGSEDVGVFMLELCDKGYFRTSQGESALSFNGLFKTRDISLRWPSGLERCGNCGYDLRGLHFPRCPECGWEHSSLSTEA